MKEPRSLLTCVVIDDEPLQVEVLNDYVLKTPSLQLAGGFTDAYEAIKEIESRNIDLVFLDIQMPQLTGLQVMEILKGKARFIMTTAYVDFALKSYEFDVLDYLVKPISFDRFYKAVEKAKSYLQHQINPSKEESKAPGDHSFLFVKSGTRIVKINLQDILYIEGLKDYISIKTSVEQVITLENMAAIESRLSQNNFIRVHKSFIVAINKINYIEKNSIIIGKTYIPIGNTYKDAFFKKIDPSLLNKK